MTVIGPHSRAHRLRKLDGRTREARMVKSLRRALVAHVGGAPSATQAVLIDRCCELALQCALMEARGVAATMMADGNHRTYLAWSNALTRTLARLGFEPAAPAAPDLRAYLAAKQPQVAA